MHSIKQKYILYAIIFLCFIGRGVLLYFGYNMGKLATSNLTKIHPVTYLVSFVFLTRLLYAPRKVISVKIPAQIYLFAVLALLVYLFFTNNANSISFIADTLLMPVLFYAYAKSLSEQNQKRIPQVALMFILLNSFMAIIERLLSVNFFPAEVEYGESFRSTALLGHPLNNGLITLIFILYVLVADFKTVRKNIYLGILLLGLVCFSPRGCLVVAAISIVLLYVGPLLFSKAKYFSKTNKSLAVTIIVLVSASLIYITLNSSFGERLLKVSFFDSSANVRVQSLNLVDFGAIQDFLWARTQNKIDEMSNEAGIQTIENFVIVWILKFGLVFTVLLLYSLSHFFVACSEVRNKKIMLLVIILFLGAASTNNSLAGSTEAVMLFVIVFLFPSRKHKFIF